MLTDERRSAIIAEFSQPIGSVGGMTIEGVVGQFRVNLFARAVEREARREAEAERDDYKAQAKEYWDIGLKRERERDALRALLLNTRASMVAVLCDHDERCCIQGSNADRAEIDNAIADIDAAMPSEGADAAIGYAHMKDERDALRALLRDLEPGVDDYWQTTTIGAPVMARLAAALKEPRT